MNPTPKKSRLQQDLDDAREDLRGLRDEIRVQLHLASMDLKAEWERMQPKLQEAEEYWDVVTDSVLETTQDLRKHLQAFKKKLAELNGQHVTRPR